MPAINVLCIYCVFCELARVDLLDNQLGICNQSKGNSTGGRLKEFCHFVVHCLVNLDCIFLSIWFLSCFPVGLEVFWKLQRIKFPDCLHAGSIMWQPIPNSVVSSQKTNHLSSSLQPMPWTRLAWVLYGLPSRILHWSHAFQVILFVTSAKLPAKLATLQVKAEVRTSRRWEMWFWVQMLYDPWCSQHPTIQYTNLLENHIIKL